MTSVHANPTSTQCLSAAPAPRIRASAKQGMEPSRPVDIIDRDSNQRAEITGLSTISARYFTRCLSRIAGMVAFLQRPERGSGRTSSESIKRGRSKLPAVCTAMAAEGFNVRGWRTPNLPLPHRLPPASAHQTGRSDMARHPAVATRRRRTAGFTLIEIMVVIAILGILAAIVVPRFIGRTDDARRQSAAINIRELMQQLELYKLDNSRYPTTEQGLKSLVEKPTIDPIPNNWKAGGYINRVPVDPWGNQFQYLNPGLRGTIDVFSLGADGRPGGEGNDADIGSWQL